MIIRYYYFIFWLFAFIDSLLLVKEKQESGRERRGETCSKGCGERDSNTQLAVRPEPICAYARTPRPSRRTAAADLYGLLTENYPECNRTKYQRTSTIPILRITVLLENINSRGQLGKFELARKQVSKFRLGVLRNGHSLFSCIQGRAQISTN